VTILNTDTLVLISTAEEEQKTERNKERKSDRFGREREKDGDRKGRISSERKKEK
jgi:hypothetical protein